MSILNKTYGLFTNRINKKIVEKISDSVDQILEFDRPIAIKNELTNDENEILLNLQNIDWIIFTDINSVEFFIQTLEDLEIELFELDNLRILAFGESVADRLRYIQIHADIIVNILDDDLIFQQLKDYIYDENEFKGLSILFIKNKELNFNLSKLLANSISSFLELNIYISKFSDISSKQKLLFQNGAVDEFLFFEPSDVFDLKILFYPAEFRDLFNEVIAKGADQNTLNTLNEAGINGAKIK